MRRQPATQSLIGQRAQAGWNCKRGKEGRVVIPGAPSMMILLGTRKHLSL